MTWWYTPEIPELRKAAGRGAEVQDQPRLYEIRGSSSKERGEEKEEEGKGWREVEEEKNGTEMIGGRGMKGRKEKITWKK